MHNALKRAGIATFLDAQDISAGANFAANIRDAVGHADCVIFVGTPSAFSSSWAANEVRFATDMGIPILPIIFGNYPDDSQVNEIGSLLLQIAWLVEDEECLSTGPSPEGLIGVPLTSS